MLRGEEEFEAQRKAAKAEFIIARDFSELRELRMKAILEFFLRVGTGYEKFSKNPKGSVSIDDLLPYDAVNMIPIIPGVPGTQDEAFKVFVSAISQISMEFAAMSNFSIDYVQSQLKDEIQKHEARRTYIVAVAKEIGSTRRKAWKELISMQAANRKISDQIRKLHGELEKAKSKNNTKLVTSTNEKMTKLCQEYVSSMQEIKLKVGKFNEINSIYMKTIIDGTGALKKLEMENYEWLTSFIVPLIEAFISNSHATTQGGETLNSLHKRSSEGFAKFAISAGLFRTVRNDHSAFVPYEMSFSDHAFVNNIEPPVPSLRGCPISIAKVKKDFEGENPGELSVNKDDMVALYEKPVSNWCLVSAAGQIGYIPSCYLDPMEATTAICKCCYFGHYSTDLTVKTGEMVILLADPATKEVIGDELPENEVEELTSSFVYCRNLSGKEGTLPKYLICK